MFIYPFLFFYPGLKLRSNISLSTRKHIFIRFFFYLSVLYSGAGGRAGSAGAFSPTLNLSQTFFRHKLKFGQSPIREDKLIEKIFLKQEIGSENTKIEIVEIR